MTKLWHFRGYVAVFSVGSAYLLIYWPFKTYSYPQPRRKQEGVATLCGVVGNEEEEIVWCCWKYVGFCGLFTC